MRMEADGQTTPKAAPKPSDSAVTPEAAAPKMSEAELRSKLQEVFDSFDADHSGTVSTKEMFDAASELELGISPEKLAELIKETDADGSGEVDFEEFLTALRKHLAGDEGAADGLGSVFAAKTGSMFADMWSNWTSSPFKGALDNIMASPMSLFAGPSVVEKAGMQAEEQTQEVARRDLAEQLDAEAKTTYGKWDLTTSPPRKAATPKRSDCASYSPKKALVTGVPKGTFRDENQAKSFFSAPRVASTGAHSAAHMAKMQTRTNWSSPAPLPFKSEPFNVRPRQAPWLGNNAGIALSRAAGRSGSTPPGSRS